MVDALVANLPILLCVIAGMALMVLEAVLPGFGVPGISGIILLVVGIWLTISAHGVLVGLGLLIVIIAILTVLISIILKSTASGKLSKSKLILQDTVIDPEEEKAREDMQVFVGHTGQTLSILRPAGIADFDGVRLNVVTEGEFIEKGQSVEIVRIEGTRFVVREIGT